MIGLALTIVDYEYTWSMASIQVNAANPPPNPPYSAEEFALKQV